MSSPFRTPQAPVKRDMHHMLSSGKPPKHPSSDTKDSGRRSSVRNLASSALMSPGVDLGLNNKSILSPSTSINGCISTPHSEAQKSFTGSESPFREWATNSLGCLATDVVSPERDDDVLMAPSYSDLSAKMENSPMHNMSSRDEDLSMACKPTGLEGNLTEVDTAFPPSALGQQGSKQTGKASGSTKGGKKAPKGGAAASQECLRGVKLEQTEALYDLAPLPLEPLSHHMYTPQQPMVARKPLVLVECHLFTFEMRDNKVFAQGFDHVRTSDHKTLLNSSRAKSQRPMPNTPALDKATPQHTLDIGSATQTRVCSCKKSRCLKLYCECFAAGDLCDQCKCVDCANDGQHEAQRLQAVENIKQRNSNAFAPKIVDEEQDQPVGAHARGCRCKKSHCLKKYCECFQAQVKCTGKCKCEDCKNMSTRPDETPRERCDHTAAFSALINPQSGSKGYSPERTGRKGGDSILSPPRNKKPRVLDFNVMATPSHSTPLARLGTPVSSSPSARPLSPRSSLIQALVP